MWVLGNGEGWVRGCCGRWRVRGGGALEKALVFGLWRMVGAGALGDADRLAMRF